MTTAEHGSECQADGAVFAQKYLFHVSDELVENLLEPGCLFGFHTHVVPFDGAVSSGLECTEEQVFHWRWNRQHRSHQQLCSHE